MTELNQRPGYDTFEFISQKNTFKPVGWKELLDRPNAGDLSNSMCNRQRWLNWLEEEFNIHQLLDSEF